VTEAEWLAGERPWDVRGWFANTLSPRKLRLFACACCRNVAHLAREPGYEAALEVLERFADGTARDADRIRAGKQSVADALPPNLAGCLLSELRQAAAKTIGRGAEYIGQGASAAVGYTDERRFQALKAEEQRRQMPLLRDLAGNPFRPVACSARWCTDTALSLARQMYEARDFGAMPMLADALQDAGCDNDEILNHCRGLGPHVRGCWVVDLVLARE
jgi:hypothetical protein